MKYTLKRKDQNPNNFVFQINLDMEDGKITFPSKIDVKNIYDAIGENMEKFKKDVTLFEDLINLLHFFQNIHDEIDNVLGSSEDPQTTQDNFMSFVEEFDTKIRMVAFILGLETDVDFKSTDVFVTIVFWPLLSKIMDDAENIPQGNNDTSTGEDVKKLLEATVRRDLFRGIVGSNEKITRKLVNEANAEASDDDKDFFTFVNDMIDDIVSDNKK